METNVLSPIPEKEFERILDLSELDLDYTNLSEQFNDLTKLAAKVAGTEISLINLIDSFTQWSVANYGLPVTQTPREDTVCQYTIMGDEPLEIADLRDDIRFSKRDYVINEPNLRYYYGIPLKSEEGNSIGALCVLDENKKHLTPEKVEMLKIIADEIVDRLYSYKAMNDLKSKLEASDKDRRNLSHDIRGPLGGIIGLAQIIEEQGNENKMEDILQLAELIRKGGQSILELADEILSAKEDSEERKPKDNEFTLHSLKEKLEQLYTPQAAAKGIDLTIANHSKDADLPFPRNKIVQIIGNVISNAIKFTPEGGMVMVRQELSASGNTQDLLLTIKDTGIGLSEEKIREIQNGEATSTQGTDGENGYGFGLSLVKHLIEKMGGKLEISSKEGDGCRFDITLHVKTKG